MGGEAGNKIQGKTDGPDEGADALGKGGLFFLIIICFFILVIGGRFGSENHHDSGYGHNGQRDTQTQCVQSGFAENDQREDADDVQAHSDGTGPLAGHIFFRFDRGCGRMTGGNRGRPQNFIDIADTGDGKTVGGFRDLAFGDEVVVAVQGVLQDLLADIFAVGSACEEQVHILL